MFRKSKHQHQQHQHLRDKTAMRSENVATHRDEPSVSSSCSCADRSGSTSSGTSSGTSTSRHHDATTRTRATPVAAPHDPHMRSSKTHRVPHTTDARGMHGAAHDTHEGTHRGIAGAADGGGNNDTQARRVFLPVGTVLFHPQTNRRLGTLALTSSHEPVIVVDNEGDHTVPNQQQHHQHQNQHQHRQKHRQQQQRSSKPMSSMRSNPTTSASQHNVLPTHVAAGGMPQSTSPRQKMDSSKDQSISRGLQSTEQRSQSPRFYRNKASASNTSIKSYPLDGTTQEQRGTGKLNQQQQQQDQYGERSGTEDRATQRHSSSNAMTDGDRSPRVTMVTNPDGTVSTTVASVSKDESPDGATYNYSEDTIVTKPVESGDGEQFVSLQSFSETVGSKVIYPSRKREFGSAGMSNKGDVMDDNVEQNENVPQYDSGYRGARNAYGGTYNDSDDNNKTRDTNDADDDDDDKLDKFTPTVSRRRPSGHDELGDFGTPKGSDQDLQAYKHHIRVSGGQETSSIPTKHDHSTRVAAREQEGTPGMKSTSEIDRAWNTVTTKDLSDDMNTTEMPKSRSANREAQSFTTADESDQVDYPGGFRDSKSKRDKWDQIGNSYNAENSTGEMGPSIEQTVSTEEPKAPRSTPIQRLTKQVKEQYQSPLTGSAPNAPYEAQAARQA